MQEAVECAKGPKRMLTDNDKERLGIIIRESVELGPSGLSCEEIIERVTKITKGVFENEELKKFVESQLVELGAPGAKIDLDFLKKDSPVDEVHSALTMVAKMPQLSSLDIDGYINKINAKTGSNKASLRKDLKQIVESIYGVPEVSEPQEEERPKQIVWLENDEVIADVVWSVSNKRTLFAVYDKSSGVIAYKDSLFNDELVLPMMDDGVIKGAVVLPTEASDYGTELELIEEVRRFIHKYLDVGTEFENITIYYILLTWVYDKVNTIPYLRVRGDTGVGKSRFLDVISKLCYRSSIASGAITPAPIYRLISRWEGTMTIDEADFSDSDFSNEVIKILNCGFERDRPVLRCVKDDPDNLQFLKVFGPKVLATRQAWKDKALEARCITKIMTQTDRHDIPPVLLPDFYLEQTRLRNKLLMFRFRNLNKITMDSIKDFNIKGIEPRLQQIGSAFAIFASIDGLKEHVEQFFQKMNLALIEERAETFEGQIINALIPMIDAGEEASAQDVADVMNVGRKDKEKVSSRSLGRHLKSLGLEIKVKKVDGEPKRVISSSPDLLQNLRRRYIPGEVTTVTSVTSVTWTDRNSAITDFTTGSSPPQNNVTDVTEDSRQPKGDYVTNVTDATNVTKTALFLPKDIFLQKYESMKDSDGFACRDDLLKEISTVVGDTKAASIIERMVSEGLFYEPSPGKIKKV